MKNMDRKRKPIQDTQTYEYIRKVRKWMFCPNCKDGKMTINRISTSWQCKTCGYKLFADEYENDYVFWFCDKCEAYLNNQNNFERNANKHICAKCGHENDITFDNIKGICSECGKILPDKNLALCEDCRINQIEKKRENIVKIGTGILIAGAIVGSIAGAVAHAVHEQEDDDADREYPFDDESEGSGLRCANCGNSDEDTLWDEGDTIYCSKCCHRTRTDNGGDDSVECPYCHRLRDRKAMYCRWCNDTSWEPSTQEEFDEIDELIKRYED